MYKIVCYRSSLIIGYVFVDGIGKSDYPQIYTEIMRALKIKRSQLKSIAFMLAD